MDSCIFCKIINKEIPSTIIKESEHAIAIKDLHPKAPIHYLVLPKKHIKNLFEFNEQDTVYYAAMLKLIKELGDDLINPQAFNTLTNNGAEAGQTVFHLHMHFLAGKKVFENIG